MPLIHHQTDYGLPCSPASKVITAVIAHQECLPASFVFRFWLCVLLVAHDDDALPPLAWDLIASPNQIHGFTTLLLQHPNPSRLPAHCA